MRLSAIQVKNVASKPVTGMRLLEVGTAVRLELPMCSLGRPKPTNFTRVLNFNK
jgi:hypothetical protein